MQKYLASSKYIDSHMPEILVKAKELATGIENKEAIVKACFEFVRDEIKHSQDYQLDLISCKASDVLQYGTGYCYAKSHLLAALLRANGIPAGLCYQRLTINNNMPPFCLHGLNAVFLQKHGWYRIDPRGNKVGINADFCPPQEKLAFPIIHQGEMDIPEVYAEPLASVVDTLESYSSYIDVANNLPDIEPIL